MDGSALLLKNAKSLATYPICSEKLPSLVHIINHSSDIRSCLQTFIDTLLDAGFEFAIVTSWPATILQVCKVPQEKGSMSEDHSMPVGQIENILLALEDGYQRHMGHRVEKMSEVFSPLNKLLGMYGRKCVFVITRCCVDGVDVSKNHAQNSRHPTAIISFTVSDGSEFNKGGV